MCLVREGCKSLCFVLCSYEFDIVLVKRVESLDGYFVWWDSNYFALIDMLDIEHPRG